MLAAGEFSAATAFSGAAVLPTQPPPSPSSPASKTRASQRVLPLTVKQLTAAFSSPYSSAAPDGNVRILGLVVDRADRPTDVTFTLHDGTGRIVLTRWMNEATDAEELAAVRNGVYVTATCNVKGFRAKGLAVAFNVRLVTDFNDVALHFFECIYVHLKNRRKEYGFHPNSRTNLTIDAPSPYRVKGYQVPLSNQFVSHPVVDASRNDIYMLVLEAFREPASLVRENGLHVNEVVRRLGIPINTVMDAISYHVDVGNIYSTIDEYHFKSACNG